MPRLAARRPCCSGSSPATGWSLSPCRSPRLNDSEKRRARSSPRSPPPPRRQAVKAACRFFFRLILHDALNYISSAMRILLIEDDKEAAAYLMKALREAGHNPDHASDGDEGAAMAAEGAYEVLVVDRMLPKRDGLSVVEQMRAN